MPHVLACCKSAQRTIQGSLDLLDPNLTSFLCNCKLEQRRFLEKNFYFLRRCSLIHLFIPIIYLCKCQYSFYARCSYIYVINNLRLPPNLLVLITALVCGMTSLQLPAISIQPLHPKDALKHDIKKFNKLHVKFLETINLWEMSDNSSTFGGYILWKECVFKFRFNL